MTRGDTVGIVGAGTFGTALAVALARAGYDAFLIGERFMADRDPGAALQSLLADVTRLAGEAAR